MNIVAQPNALSLTGLSGEIRCRLPRIYEQNTKMDRHSKIKVKGVLEGRSPSNLTTPPLLERRGGYRG